ncbi:MAG TPA: glycerol-3-phosphate dehydrogenase/oxidase [Gemmatimonadaceae bacterium]|nr:glycerol-3-phosphate dehydrogenase/oxidase [Gemmatimonadaceae bacterium]
MSLWGPGWREAVWRELEGGAPWDVVVVGGGVAGAGVLREAVRAGLRVLLLEGRDFAWGTSSRSSKLVHGGLRYLQQGQWRVTRESVRERDRLMREAPGLVEPVRFLRAVYHAERRRRWLYEAFFTAYDLLGAQQAHAYHSADELRRLAPPVAAEGLLGGFSYVDARTDDARLVLRLLREAAHAGGRALSYARVESLVQERGAVAGVRVRDAESGRAAEVRARAVVNATGAAADVLRGEVAERTMMRPLRGSHLVFAAGRLPLAHAVAWRHPADGRNVCAVPWEGVTVVGTTDVDDDAPAGAEPRASAAETSYLLAGAAAHFPALGLVPDDIVSTWAGVRPVVGGGRADPSRESRESQVVEERGLITVAGGKLTTFRPTAVDAIARLRDRFPRMRAPARESRAFDDVPPDVADHPALDAASRQRLAGRHGRDAAALLAAARDGELETIPDTLTRWAELRWAARAEGVTHLDDLLLRRARLGLLLPSGGAALLPEVRRICQPELGWSDARWAAEEAAYLALWNESYAPPVWQQHVSRG